MVQQRSIPIALPSLGTEEWEAVREPLESGWVTQGPRVAAFERAFAERHGLRFALATTSCTTALHLALDALGVGPGDEVIVPAFTWVATPNAAVYCGATPVFADVEPDTYNLDPADVATKLTKRTRVVVAVHLFGLCVDVDALRAILPPEIAVLEDAACAAGASLGGRSAGGLGDVAAFSFHPRKSITTGEGGMVTTDDQELAERMERRRNHGAAVSEEVRHHGPAPYLLPAFDEIGFNYRMTDFQAAIGLVQLGKLERFIEERDRWARWYEKRLTNLSWLRTPARPEGGGHGWQAYVTDIDEDAAPAPRNELMARLQKLGVSTRPGTHNAAGLDVYRRRRDPGHDSCPVSARLERTTMALPLHNRMSAEDYEYVVEALASLEA